jgi:hypothetical protein
MRKEESMAEEHKDHPAKENKPLEKMTVKDLKEIAMAIPHEHTEVAVSDMKKDELVAFIKNARGVVDESPAKKQKAKPKTELTKQEIKKKIKELREEKKSVQDKSREDILRRQINRLKKLSRKSA